VPLRIERVERREIARQVAMADLPQVFLANALEPMQATIFKANSRRQVELSAFVSRLRNENLPAVSYGLNARGAVGDGAAL